ncbi:MAG: hypothetical protein H0Z29_11735 [Candidatus Marinimicrobia bacterium]|nr:hypothetical protein [Candidatus Neomarinimicrobiota bacterium]
MRKKLTYNMLITLLAVLVSFLNGQNRGNRLGFQGLELLNYPHEFSYGGLYLAFSGDIKNLFFNPAGLSDVKDIQILINGSSINKKWYERQDYRNNRQLVTASFILDGLYTPPDTFNGMIDYEAFLLDTADNYYIVSDPDLGEYQYDEESADWEEKKSRNVAGLNVSIPLNLFNKKITIAAGYNKTPIYNYDRNETYLDPHFSDDKYNAPSRVTKEGDSVRINWYDFKRSRFGDLDEICFAVGFDISENVKLGLGYKYISGMTNDYQMLSKVAYFDLIKGYNTFRFSYDSLDLELEGESEFSAHRLNLGILYEHSRFNIGINVNLPYTISRNWQYDRTIAKATSERVEISGNDKLKLPMTYSAGIVVKPADNFIIGLSYNVNKLSRVKVERKYNQYEIPVEYLFMEDTLNVEENWSNMDYFTIGVIYSPVKNISLSAGYSYIPAVFIPDNVAIKDRGPMSDLFSFSLSTMLPFGEIIISYELNKLKYYDIYFSNTNYCTEKLDRLTVGYKISL